MISSGQIDRTIRALSRLENWLESGIRGEFVRAALARSFDDLRAIRLRLLLLRPALQGRETEVSSEERLQCQIDLGDPSTLLTIAERFAAETVRTYCGLMPTAIEIRSMFDGHD